MDRMSVLGPVLFVIGVLALLTPLALVMNGVTIAPPILDTSFYGGFAVVIIGAGLVVLGR